MSDSSDCATYAEDQPDAERGGCTECRGVGGGYYVGEWFQEERCSVCGVVGDG